MTKELKIIPLGDKIIIKTIQEETKTGGGLFLPDSAQEEPQTGIVLATGNGRILENGKTEPMEIKVGDTVLFVKYAGTDIRHDGEDYRIMATKDVLGIIEK